MSQKSRSGRLAQVSTSNWGTIGELAVATWLLRKGYYVYHSMTPNAPFDLIVLVGKKTMVRIEVRTGYYDHRKQLIFSKSNPLRFDVMAVALLDQGKVKFFRPLVATHLKKGLKVVPRNAQAKVVYQSISFKRAVRIKRKDVIY